MKGVVLADEAVVRGMDAEAAGRYIPVSLGSGGFKGREYLLSETEFAEAIAYIKRKVSAMAQTLQCGDIEPAPLLQNHFGCDFCPYFAVCGREYTEQDVTTEKIGRDEVLQKMEKEGETNA